MNNIYICHTQYHLLITMVKTMKNKEKNNEVMLNYSLHNKEVIKERLIKTGLFSSVYLFEHSDKEIQVLAENVKNQLELKKAIKRMIKDYQSLSVLEGKNVYIFNDDSIIGNYLRINRKKYKLIEDGLDSYKNVEEHYSFENSLKEKIKRFLNTPSTCFGKSRYVKEIEVNSKEGIKLFINKKMIEVPRNELFNDITEENKKIIKFVFLGQDIELGNIDGATLILTQPLYKDGFLDTKIQQIQMYKEIIEKYGSNNIIIKPHPRDDIEYAKEISKCIVLEKEFPIEILRFFDNIKCDRVITAFSTSIESIDFANEKIKLGYNWVEKYRNGK